jgi:hypothetical protein
MVWDRRPPQHAYVYFRDPDGHRVELFNTHYQIMDIENEPVGWDPSDHTVSIPGACRRGKPGSTRRQYSRAYPCMSRR